MGTKLPVMEFLLGATACVKAAQSFTTNVDGVSLPEADAPVVNVQGNGLCVVYLVDRDDGLIYVQNRHLHGTNLTPESLHELGLHNLAERGGGKLRLQQYGSIYGLTLDGLFEASLVLIDQLWDISLAHLAPNGFVAAIPSRDVLAVCDAKSVEGIAALRNMVQRVLDGGDHLISKELYRRQNGNWVIFQQ